MTKKSKYDMPAVQNFAFGGIANPSQRAFLRGSDQSYLSARQKELDAFESQRLAYNDQLTKWQSEVYNPYKAQADAYNTAAQKYNEEVYNPYKTQYDTYLKSIEAYNAGPRTEDYAGPAEPTLAREFGMAAPTAPEAFKGAAPVLPFKEEEVVARQQEAAGRARKDAGNRAVAIDVVSNPEQFNFGSMSVSNRFMAEGGEVMQDDPHDKTASAIIKDFESYGYTKEEIMALADDVAAKGRGGDELLAYLSPESVEFLKAQGGSGTINPATGLHEFKGGVLGKVANAVKRAFGRGRSAAPAAAAAPSEAPVAAPTGPSGPSAAELQKQLADANSARTALQSKYDTDLAGFKTQAQKDQEAAIANALRADADKRASMISAPVIGTSAAPTTAKDMLAKTPVPTPTPKSLMSARELTGSQVGNLQVQAPSVSFDPVRAAAPIPQMDLRGRITSPVSGGQRQPQSGAPSPTAQGPDTGGGLSPYVANTPSYSDRGVGAVGSVSSGNIPIFGPNVPSYGGSPIGSNRAATNPSNYFAMTPQTSTGLAPGSVAIGSPDLPMYGAMNTMGAIGANKNLSPTMLGGQQNAGVMTDRLGNQIYSPGANLFGGPPGFAKGGGVDVNALLAQNTETLSDEKPEEVINTDPVGTAQKFLADLSSAGKASPTRQSIKRTKTSAGGGATADKAMQMAYEDIAKGDLGAMKDRAPAVRNTESARSQMEELARVYQLKIRAAQNAARGLSADTFGAPTLEGPTLTKSRLTKKRFAEGGEAKKAVAESAQEPGIFGVTDYATKASARMFPEQMGQDDQRDAARHMLAAAVLAKKTGPGMAVFMGKAHERISNPESFFSMLGIGKPRDDYEMDVHNNKLGADLGSRTTSQEELEKLVRAMAMQSQNKQVEGKPWTMSKEQMKNRKGQITTQPPEYRADGSPVEGELSQEEIDAASKPAFVTPKSGKGRKQGEISKQLKSGDAYVNMAKGVTELPYDIAGAPVDIATMLMRPFGYSTEKPVMSSDWIKQQMTDAKVRPEPPADPTAKGFYTAGELLSNLTNPAGVARKVGPVVEKGVKAGAMEAGRQLDRAILDDAGPLSKFVPQSAKPLYAVRPTGSTMLTGNRGLDGNVITVSAMDQLLANGISNAGNVAGRNTGQAKLIAEFWDKKARNYFERQFGTPDDPIMEAIKTGRIKGPTMSSDLQQGFPAHLIDSLAQGKTRYKEGARTEGFVGPGAPEGRFFPKYPEAVEDFTSRYDKATGLKGNFLTRDPAAADPAYDMLSTRGREMAKDAADIEADKLIAQGVRPELINTEVGTVTRSVKDPTRVVGEGTSSAKAMYDAFEQAVAPGKTNEPSKTGLLNKLFGESKPAGGTNEAQSALNVLPENVLTALRKGEPVYDIGYSMDKRLSTLFKPASVNEYLATLPPRELANIRFEDAIRGGLKLTERAAALDNVASRIKAGKPVADSVFSNGVSAPLLQIKEGPLEGFAWKRIEKREATVPEGAYVGHSVGGYELGGATYTKEKREGFNTGRYQVYTLRDNRNRPVNTVEVQMLDELTPVVMQIKGNGRATGNVPAEKYDKAVLDFFENYLRPAKIEEKDEFLTPLLKTYKEGVNSTFKMP